MGGSIGTALFVSIGLGLMNGGPASLLLGFIFYSCVISSINSSIAEMAVYMPIPGSFIRYAGKWVDEAFGFVAGWNLFLYEAILVPFEISALSLVLTFWRDDIPVWAVCIVCIALYTAINIGAVHVFGEAEFWLSSGKVLLVFLLFGFTVVTMVGGNPKGDSYGFRYWNNPGAFAEHITTASLGKFEGFLGAVFVAAFTVCGPEYISMVAGEAIYPRVTIKLAFKTVYLRFGCFFILGAFCVGIVLPYNDQTLANVLGTQGGSTGASSPYVIAMQNLGIDGLPHVVNALLVTSIFSAGNTYYYMATRSLYSLAVNKQAPAFFSKTTKSGAPIWCFAATMTFSFSSLLQLGAGSAQALQWLVNLVTASQQLNYAIIGTTYLFFYRALKTQGFDRGTLPYKGWCQPHVNCFGLTFVVIVVIIQGYTVFLPGYWNIGSFLTYYTMMFVCAVLFVGWKVLKRTKFVCPEDADLVWDKPIIDAYEASIDPPPGLWTEMGKSLLSLFRINRNKSEKGTEV
ncbi:putative general amino acid permease agp2 [Diplodia seriata]|uniref:Putative general amino acid permease agp2 n=1 Tax=Diplodia seriata TaxID=420778 RepID=A0A0G2DW57_9PEZI|nr:putative general amino acid permease agp2 [Diplodia seriata]